MSVLHKELDEKEAKLKYKKLEIMQPGIKNKSIYSRDSLIQLSLLNNNRGRGGRGLIKCSSREKGSLLVRRGLLER